MCRSTSAPSLRDLALTPDLSGPCVAIVALAADKDAQGFVRRTRRTRLDRCLHRCAGIKPGPLAGRIAGACDFAWAHERGRARRKASAQARPRTGSPGQRLAACHRLALSHRGAQRRGRRGGPNGGRRRRRAWPRPGVCPRPERVRLMAPNSPLMAKARSALSTVFGFSDFRPGQEDVLAATLAGEDVLAVMPTGSGKSLCFQLPAIVRGGLTLGGFAADRADARPGRPIARGRGRGGEPQFLLRSRRTPEGRAWPRRAFAETSLYRARTAVARRHDRRLEEGRGRSSRHRRGALRLAMGSRFPP